LIIPSVPIISVPKVSKGGSGGRGALLDSITGFKGGLKKVPTNDRSTPAVVKDKEAPVSSSGSPSGNNMMAQMMAQRNKIVSKKDTIPGKGGADLKPLLKAALAQESKATIPKTQEPKEKGAPARPSFPSNSSPTSPTSIPSSTSTPSSGLNNTDLAALKEEILNEVRQELQQMKEEIIAAIQGNFQG